MTSPLVTRDRSWGFAQGGRHLTAKGKTLSNVERHYKTQKGNWQFVAVSIISVRVDTSVQMNHSGCVLSRPRISLA